MEFLKDDPTIEANHRNSHYLNQHKTHRPVYDNNLFLIVNIDLNNFSLSETNGEI